MQTRLHQVTAVNTRQQLTLITVQLPTTLPTIHTKLCHSCLSTQFHFQRERHSKGTKWVWLFIDRKSRYMFVKFSKRKDADTAAMIMEDILIEISKMGWTTHSVRHDGEAALQDPKFNMIADMYNIKNMNTLARTPNHNRIEQNIRWTKDRLRTVLHAAKLPITEFYSPALLDIIHKHNTIPMAVLGWKSPYELVMRRKPRLHRARAFGSMGHLVKPHDKRKTKVGSLVPFSVPCVVLHESQDRPGHHVYRGDGKRSSPSQHIIINDLVRTRDKTPSLIKERGLLNAIPNSNMSHGHEGIPVDLPLNVTGLFSGALEATLGDWQCFTPGWTHEDAAVLLVQIGMPFAKQFIDTDGQRKWFRGAVIAKYIDDDGVEQFIIEYIDKDTEDLDSHEVTEGIKVWAQAIAANTGAPKMPTRLFEHDGPTTVVEDDEEIPNLIPIGEDSKAYSSDESSDESESEDTDATVEKGDDVEPEAKNEHRTPPLRRSTRTPIPSTRYSPSSPATPIGRTEAESDKESEDENEKVEESTEPRVIYFIKEEDPQTLTMNDQDGMFEIDDTGNITAAIWACSPGEKCGASLLLHPPKPVTQGYAMAAGNALNYKAAMKSKYAKDYKDAADKEIANLDSKDVLRYVTREEMLKNDPNAVPLLMGWSLLRKIDALTGEVKSTKGRAYLRGDLTIPDRDYCANSVYSNTVSIDSVKLALGFAGALGHHVLSFDVSGAYLNSRPTRPIYVRLPEGYKRVDQNNRELYGLICRALYGNPEAGARWSQDCNTTLKDQLWLQSISEPYLFRTTANIGGKDRYSNIHWHDVTETADQCTKRVKAWMDSHVTQYEVREEKMANDITKAQKDTQEDRKILRQRSKCYTLMSRSDDIQNRNIHNIPDGEAFPHIVPYDETTLCSSLPTNDVANVLWCNLLLFVDDGLVITNNENFGKAVIEAFLRVHPGKMEVKPQAFLGLGLRYGEDGSITVTQTPLIEDMAKISELEKCHPAPTPLTRLVDKEECPKDDSLQHKKMMEDLYPYRTVLGKMLYACHSRPELRLATSQWARVGINPGVEHHNMIKRGVRYLMGTKTMGAIYGRFKSENNDPYVLCDANHGSGSISGIIGFCGGAAYAARSWKQKNINLYSFGSEQVALCDAVKLAIWTKEVAIDMGLPPRGPIRVYDDSQALIKAATTDVSSTKTRHLRNRMAWVKDMIKEGRVELIFVGTKDNVADALTKPLPRESFKILRDQMLGITEVTCRAENMRTDRENTLAYMEGANHGEDDEDKPDCKVAMLLRAATQIEDDDNDDRDSDHSQDSYHGHPLDAGHPDEAGYTDYSDESWYPSCDEDGSDDDRLRPMFIGITPGYGVADELPRWNSQE